LDAKTIILKGTRGVNRQLFQSHLDHFLEGDGEKFRWSICVILGRCSKCVSL